MLLLLFVDCTRLKIKFILSYLNTRTASGSETKTILSDTMSVFADWAT